MMRFMEGMYLPLENVLSACGKLLCELECQSLCVGLGSTEDEHATVRNDFPHQLQHCFIKICFTSFVECDSPHRLLRNIIHLPSQYIVPGIHHKQAFHNLKSTHSARSTGRNARMKTAACSHSPRLCKLSPVVADMPASL
jgi:hypothetical protein